MPKHEVPIKLIDFVAKTGFITKDLWRKYFFTGGNDRWMHQSWTNLHENEYLKPHPEPALKDVSVLNLKSRNLKFLLEGKPVKHVYANHINHDVHLYDGLLTMERDKFVSSWETEAQIKSRLGQVFYHNGYSGVTVKFPDAIIDLPNGKLPWAVEMEMTLKNKRRYERTMDAYNSRRDLAGVLFICRQKSMMDALSRAKRAVYYTGSEILFMDLDIWQERPETCVKYMVKELCTPPATSA